MELISGVERNRLIGRVFRDAFHLELRDDYSVPVEDGPYERWLRGEPDNLEWFAPWAELVGRVTRAGRSVRRVRVVTEPHSPYIQWEHATVAANERAGEAIRWLPRHKLPDGLRFPVDGNDWWLFDDNVLAVGHFNEAGRVLGSEIIETPAVVAECIHVRDLLWSIAVPTIEYRA
ncbi:MULTISPECIES: DUF6879 family protein [unclassified Streptomyces]|uniref:DUF6879 family protein n=1 Tax=unclassified Streptomyces TaxID=2593676 RepID=UPI002E29E09F|nr:DUF6879 family protein [Streptomyces sp. NBC_01423]